MFFSEHHSLSRPVALDLDLRVVLNLPPASPVVQDVSVVPWRFGEGSGRLGWGPGWLGTNLPLFSALKM